MQVHYRAARVCACGPHDAGMKANSEKESSKLVHGSALPLWWSRWAERAVGANGASSGVLPAVGFFIVRPPSMA